MFCIWFIPCIAKPPLSLAMLFIWFIILFMLVFISPYPPPQLFAVGPMGRRIWRDEHQHEQYDEPVMNQMQNMMQQMQ